jgi:hypothetical protein
MNKYLLKGYNSGGYRDTRNIEFDGEIYKNYNITETEDGINTEIEYIYKYSNGKEIKDNGELLFEIVKKFSWNESFITCEIVKE